MSGDVDLKDPFSFAYGDEKPNRRTAVFQALGAASVCWENPAGAGVFDSTRAKEIGEALVDELDLLDQPLLGLATTRDLVGELVARLDWLRDKPASEATVGGEGDPDPSVRYAAGDAHAALLSFLDTNVARVLDYRTVDS